MKAALSQHQWASASLEGDDEFKDFFCLIYVAPLPLCMLTDP